MEYSEPGSAPATLSPAFRITFDDLAGAFGSLEDPRKNHNKVYSLKSLLLAVTAAILCNQLNLLAAAEWLALQSEAVKQTLGFEGDRTPHQTTLHRAFKKLSAQQLQTAPTGYFERERGQPQAVPARGTQSVAIDGKCQRGRLPFEPTEGTPCHILSAFCRELGRVLAQVAIKNKEAELTVAPDLLAAIDWQGRILTGDAIFQQRNLCQMVVEAGGDYLFVVKGTQLTLQDNVAQLFEPPTKAELNREGRQASVPLLIEKTESFNKGHGRLELRFMRTSTELAEYSAWPYLEQVFEVERLWFARGKWHKEVHWGVTSLPAGLADAARLLEVRRGHWTIENLLNWVKDVGLLEDKSTIHVGEGPQVMGALRNTALNLLRGAGVKQIASRLRHNSQRPTEALTLLGLQLPCA